MAEPAPTTECPVCREDRDPEDLMDHVELGLCCHWCACHHDFPPDLDLDLSEDV